MSQDTSDKKYVTLTDHASGKTYDFPVLSGSVGPDAES